LGTLVPQLPKITEGQGALGLPAHMSIRAGKQTNHRKTKKGKKRGRGGEEREFQRPMKVGGDANGVRKGDESCRFWKKKKGKNTKKDKTTQGDCEQNPNKKNRRD